jgi:hypothetical protein
MQLAPISLWIARLLWVSLPLTAGFAAADALEEWSTASGILAAACCWVAWAAGLVALLAPRPVGLTALRAIAPSFLLLAVVLLVAEPSAARWLAAGFTALAAVSALGPGVAMASVNGASYGDERRFPLKIPPALFLGPIPLAPPIITGGAVVGPLLLADGELGLGLVALLAIPFSALAARSLHTLARRFAVLVPAGIALIDPFSLVDPVLLPREHIRSLRPVAPGRRPVEATLDLRLGAVRRSLAISLDRVTDSLQVRRARRVAENVKTDEIWFSATGSGVLVADAGARRIRTG